jgi:hypothetical protein
MNFLNAALAYLTSNSDAIVSIGSFIMLAVSKFVSTDKARAAEGKLMQSVSKVQLVLDGIGTGIRLFGALLAKSCEIIAKIIESDGYLGKQ